MKKIRIPGIIMFILIFSISIGALDLGDVNGDREINIVDALLIARWYVGLIVPDFYEDAADVNCSEEVDIIDALLVAQYYVGLIPELSCPEIPEPEITIEDQGSLEITSETDPGCIFFDLTYGETETVIFTIRNTGTAVLLLTADPPVSISHEGTPHNNFSILKQPETIINSGDSSTFIIQYEPDNKLFMEKKSWIIIESNAPNEPLYEFSLIGYNIDTYTDYFQTYPALADYTVNTFSKKTLNYFLSYLSELEHNGVLAIDEPDQLQKAVPPDGPSRIYLTVNEDASIWGAKAAHAIWLDKNNRVPWKLTDYNNDDLDGLFNHNELFDSVSGGFFSVVDYSPSDVYGYMAAHGLIGNTIVETMYNVFGDLRTTDDKISFIHGSTSYNDPDTVYSLYEAITTYVDRSYALVRVARRGCHSMTRIMVGMLRSVNIPGSIIGGRYYPPGHSSAVWPCVQLVMPHGDDIYTATLRNTPTNEMLAPMSIYSDPFYTGICGTDGSCVSGRHTALRAFTYPDNWIISRSCNPESYGYIDCLDYITREYGDVLTLQEIEDAVDNMAQNYCP